MSSSSRRQDSTLSESSDAAGTYLATLERSLSTSLSAASMEQLKDKTGEEIVDADIAAQMVSK